MLRQPLLATFVAMALVPATPVAAQNAWTTATLTFREGPGTQYPVIHSMPHCAALTTHEGQDGWVRAEWDGQYGWVSGRYVVESNTHCQPGYHAPAHGTAGHTRRTY